MDTTTTVPESEFAQRLGLPRQAVSAVRMRALTENTHYWRNAAAGGRVELSAEGAAIIMEQLALGAEETPAGPVEAVLVVLRQVPNARQVLAHREGEDEQLVLKVPTIKTPRTLPNGRPLLGHTLSNHFRPRQRVLAQHVEGAVWTFVGKKPRFPGDRLSLAPEKPGESPGVPGGFTSRSGDGANEGSGS